MHEPGTDFDKDPWELFDTAADFSRSIDMSVKHREKMEESKALCWT